MNQNPHWEKKIEDDCDIFFPFNFFSLEKIACRDLCILWYDIDLARFLLKMNVQQVSGKITAIYLTVNKEFTFF